MKILKRILASLVILFGGLLLLVAIFLFYQKPKYSGTIALTGLDSTVTTYFDSYGIPHIYGSNEHDLFRSLGYIHAQDRLFQMELIRRVSSGRLSELFGNKTVEVDKFFRMLGLAQHAEKSAQIFMSGPDTQIKRDVTAYLEGLNQYINRGRPRAEFLLLNIPKETFTVKDLFLIVDYISFNFQMGFKTDPLLSRIQKKWGHSYIHDLQMYTESAKPDSASQLPEITALSLPSELEELIPTSIWSGSNSWALSASRSQSGKPLLANDTHIGITQPAVWYEAYLECPGFRFYGNFLAGFPFAPIGHSEHHAWGLTMLENDDLDFFEEKVNPNDSSLVYAKDHWEKIILRNEVIKVKDSSDVNIVCRFTHHGPVCSDVMPEFKAMTKSPVSVCWTFLKFNNNLMDVTWSLAHAENMSEFREAVSRVSAPGLNIVYADINDNIARYTAAKFVIRPEGVASDQLLDGSGKSDWLGYYDFAVNPREENPELGFVLSTNNPPSVDSLKFFPGYYVPEDRFVRLRHLLWKKSKFNREDMEHIAMDDTNTVAAEMGKILISRLAGVDILKSQLHERAYRILENWTGSHQINDIAPTIYYKLLYYSLQNAMQDEMGQKDFEAFLKTHIQKAMLRTFLQNDSSKWWDKTTTLSSRESQHDIIQAAFDTTISQLVYQLGYNPEKWIWGKVHSIEYEHPIGKQKPFNQIFNIGPFAEMGGIETVNNQSFDLNGSGIYKVNLGPALRRAIDFGEPETVYSINPSGQSGNFMSKHYSDQVRMYISGRFRKELMNKKEIQSVCKNVLIFKRPD